MAPIAFEAGAKGASGADNADWSKERAACSVQNNLYLSRMINTFPGCCDTKPSAKS